MFTIRKSAERGFANHGWLKSYHSFSFADYYDPKHMGWGSLRVINEDWIAPGMGFGMHGHRDMEIVTYILEGQLAHQDNMGNAATITPGEIQRMSAGSGVRHSESNHFSKKEVHLLQIWIEPKERGIKPSYEQKRIGPGAGKLKLVASPNGEAGSVTIHTDSRLYAGLFEQNGGASLALDPHRKAYVHLIRGELKVNDQTLVGGDALLIEEESVLRLSDAKNAEVLVFDLPA